MADNSALALLAAADLRSLTSRPVKVFAGGLAAWRAAGFETETGATNLHDPAEDFWVSPYRDQDRFAAFRRYLDWEIALIDQIARDRTVAFKVFEAAASAPATSPQH